MSEDNLNQFTIKLDDHEIYLRESTTHVGFVQSFSQGEVTLRISDGWHRTELDISFDRLLQLRELVNAAIDNAFELNPELKCPACGYTAADAEFHGDHKHCRNFPLFPSET